jgi:hypothetical protein
MVSNYTALEHAMIAEVEGFGSGCGLIKIYPGIFLEDLRKTTKILSQDSWCPS